MGKNTDNSRDETDSINPEEADREGKVNIVKNIMNDPEVQGIIKQSLLHETIKNAIFMSAFLVGIMFIFNAVKQIAGQGPYFDLVCGMALVFIGAFYILSSMRHAKPIQR